MIHDVDDLNSLTHLWLELTGRCNLSCVHCYANCGPEARDESPLSSTDYGRILKDAFGLGCRSVQFVGGEPTVNPLLPDLISDAAEIGFERIEVFSNMTQVDSALLEVMLGSLASFATSLYSDLSELHDAITRTPGSHNRTVANIQRALKAGIAIRVGVIEMNENAHRIDQTRSFVKDLGIANVAVDRVRKIGRPAQSAEGDDAGQLCGRCWQGNICVGPSGKVFPCVMSRSWSIGSLGNQSLRSLFRSGRVAVVRGKLRDEYSERSVFVEDCAPNGDPCSPRTGPCSPEDTCSPRACHPQVGGPPGCHPQQACTPKIFGNRTVPLRAE